MTYDPNSRFQVVDTLALNPGSTLITKTVTGPFIDTGVDLNTPNRPMWRGRVYLSKDEVREMAEQLGLFDPYEEEIRRIFTVKAEERARAEQEAYDRGYAKKVDATAAQLVESMRARVQRDRDDRSDASAAADAQGAGDAAVAGAEAAVGEGRDDLPGAESAGAAGA